MKSNFLLPKSILNAIHPKYWVLWLVLSVLFLIAQLPHNLLIKLGRRLGRILLILAKKPKKVASANIAHCFSELSPIQHKQMLDASFDELGISIIETSIVWFGNLEQFFRRRVRVEGKDNLTHALSQDQGIILMSCHYGCLDLNSVLMSLAVNHHRKFLGTYRQPSDPVIDAALHRFRTRHVTELIPIQNMHKFAKSLKNKNVVWYAPDIEMNKKNSVFVPFFGKATSSNIGVSRIAKLSNAIVLPFTHYRDPLTNNYTLKIFKALENFPSEDITRDTRRINQIIEDIVRPYPERYWWTIKRFKHRPPGEAPIYSP